MDINRPLVRLAALSAAGAMVFAAVPAMAKPVARPGKVTNVKISAADITKGSGAYAVPSTWTASTKTTDYRVKLVNASGTLLDGPADITDTHWTSHARAAAGTMVRVVVTPFNGTRKGQPAQSGLVPLPDLTAPTGQFTMTANNNTGVATLTQALTDDMSQGADIKGTIAWGDGQTTATTALDSSVTHQYEPQVEHRYEPSIVLTDKAGNTSGVIALEPVVVFDSQKPAGATYQLTSGSAFTNYSPVTLDELTPPADNWSPADTIVRTVSWGDDTSDRWTTGDVPTHLYTTDGVHTVQVTLTDEAGNVSDAVFSGEVTTVTDATAPVVKFRYPAKPRNVVKKWRALRGTVTDAGVGAKQVQLKVIEKRGRAWYAYKTTTHRWVKAGTMHRAWTRAGVALMTPSATGTWGKRVVGLRKGTLTYRARAVDNLGNTSAWLVHSQKLTR